MATLLIADDEQTFLDLMVRILQKDHHLLIARNWTEVLEKFESNLWRLNTSILDVNMPGLSVDPFSMVEKLLKSNPTVPMIVMSGQDIVLKHDFLKMGVYQYLAKPLEMTDFKVTIEKAVKYNRVLRKMEYLEKEEKDNIKYFNKLLGFDLDELQAQIENHDHGVVKTPILIRGDVGTKPEMLARIISQEIDGKIFFHKICSRNLKNIIPHNIQSSDVLFLEGVENLDKEEHIYINNILEKILKFDNSNGEYTPRFRLIVSTSSHADNSENNHYELSQLLASMNKLEFRIDPLRLRQHELREIITAEFEKMKKELPSSAEMISDELYSMLINYNWPLNYDELHIIIECLLMTCPDRVLLPKHLHQLDFSDIAHTKYPTLDDMVEEHIKKALRVTMGNKSKAAKMLGITPKTLYARIRN
ncbi:MAG: response regulator [bacterium]